MSDQEQRRNRLRRRLQATRRRLEAEGRRLRAAKTNGHAPDEEERRRELATRRSVPASPAPDPRIDPEYPAPPRDVGWN